MHANSDRNHIMVREEFIMKGKKILDIVLFLKK